MKHRTPEKRAIDEALNRAKYLSEEAEKDRMAGRTPKTPPKLLYVDGERAYAVPIQKTETSRQKLERANELLAECARIDREKAAKVKATDDDRGGISPENWSKLSPRARLQIANEVAAARRAKKS